MSFADRCAACLCVEFHRATLARGTVAMLPRRRPVFAPLGCTTTYPGLDAVAAISRTERPRFHVEQRGFSA